MSGWRLLADIGGTNVRFARALGDGSIVDPVRYRVEDFAGLDAAALGYLKTMDAAGPCREAAICAAGPVFDGEVQLTNAPWRIRAAALSQAAGGIPVMLVNDLEAVALALPHLGAADVEPLGDVRQADGTRMLAVNVGTGFGAALALRAHGGWASAPSEAGHMRLCALEDADAFLRDAAGARTVEDLLSGEGLLKMYHAHRGRPGAQPGREADDVWRLAAGDAAAQACVESFTRTLAGVARDLALAAAAWGGVFLCGGVVKGWAPMADAVEFRRVFEAGGKMSHCLRATPSCVVTRGDVALLGLARMAVRG